MLDFGGMTQKTPCVMLLAQILAFVAAKSMLGQRVRQLRLSEVAANLLKVKNIGSFYEL
jgi:hypothetical protein